MDKNKTMMQYFEWYMDADSKHWTRVKENAKEIKQSGVTSVWLPPAYKGAGGLTAYHLPVPSRKAYILNTGSRNLFSPSAHQDH